MIDRRRVLVLNHFAAPLSGAGGTRHVELFGRLAQWDGVILAADRGVLTRARTKVRTDGYRTVPTSPVSGFPMSRVINWLTYSVSAFLVGLTVRRVRVVYGSSPHLLAALAGWSLARIKRVPFVLEVRDLWPKVLVDMHVMSETSKVYRLLEHLESFLYRRADGIVVMARGVIDELQSRGIPPAKLVFIPNGADPDTMHIDTPRDELRRQLGFEGLVAVYAGAHGPANGLDLLLDAAKEVAADIPDLRVVLVGDGIDKKRLQQRVASEHIDNVELRDPVPKSDIPRLLAAADVGLHVLADVDLFKYGVSPNKLFDYMAAGLPSITNTAGEVAALVRTADAGVVAEPAGLAAAFRTMGAATADQRAAWGRNGADYIRANQSRTAMAVRLETLLDDVTAR